MIVPISMLLLGCAIGAVVGYLLAERRCRANDASIQAACAAAEQRCSDLSARLEAEASNTEALRKRLSDADRAAAALSAQLAGAQQNLIEQRKLLDDAHQQLKQAFASVSAEALAKNNEAFLHLAKEKFATLTTEATGSLEQRKAQIEGLLKPMQELLGTYQSRLGDIEKSRVESYSMLREQLGSLAEIQRVLGTHTSQLVTALRRPQTRGRWGEVTLKRLVELAGMSNHCDFCEQASVDGPEGRQRPDMVVTLPGDRDIIIDCKATLEAFLDAAEAPDEDTRKVHLQRHAQQVRARARELSSRNYWAQFKNSPECVVMFLPGEAFLYAAIEQDGSIIEDCLKDRVLIATPTTLMGLLRVIEFGWRQEKIAQNAEEIENCGKDLCNRIATFVEHFAHVGTSIGSAVTNYNKAIASLESRILVTVKRMGELGAKADKELPEVPPIDTRPRVLTIVE